MEEYCVVCSGGEITVFQTKLDRIIILAEESSNNDEDGDVACMIMSKYQAKQLGEWLIKQSE